jgi:hypothetical protein
MSTVTLMPCPFCASHNPELEEIAMEIWAVTCACGVQGPVQNFGRPTQQDRAKAAELWNRRPAA